MERIAPQPLASGEKIPRARRRGCWSFVFMGATGCAAFLTGALIAGLSLSPTIFAPYFARQMSGALDVCLAGEIDVESARVGWSVPVLLRGVRLRDGAGVELLSGELELPSLLELLGAPSEPTVVRARIPSLRIALDEHGRSPLLASLVDPPSSGDAPLEPGGRLHPLNALRALQYRALGGALRLEVLCDELVWTDARASGHEARLTEVSIAITTTPRDRTLRVDLEASAKLAGSERGLRIDISVADYLAPTWEDVVADVELEDAPAALVDAYLGTEGWLGALFGAYIDARLEVTRGDPRKGTPVSGSLRGARARCDWKGTWREGELASEAVLGELSATPPLLEARLDELRALAPGPGSALEVDLEDETLPWSVEAARFEIVTGIGMPVAETAERASWTCHAELVSPARVRLVEEEAELLELGGLRWTLDRDPAGSTLVADATIQNDEGESGRLSLALERDFAAETDRAIEPRVASRVRGDAERVPAAVLDALLGRGSWIAGALGPVVDVGFSAANVRERPVQLDVTLRSPAGNVRFHGSCEDGTLVSVSESALVAELALRPAVEARLLRPLLPWLDRYESPSADPGLTLSVDAFRLPLDGECEKLQAVARLEAPSWSYGFQARLAALVTREGETPRFDGLGPYTIEITNGEAAYEGHKLASGGGTVEGEVSLVDGGLELELAVPLAPAADGAEPDEAERTSLALDLHGTLESPRLGVGFEELGELVRKGGGFLEEMRGRVNTLLQGEKKNESAGDANDDDQ